MDMQRWQQIDELFQAAVELDPAQRGSFLEAACAGDQSLRSEVEAMLASDSEGWDFVEKPALEAAAALLVDDQPQLASGETIGHYRIVNVIGRGGMGEVYLAEDERLGRKVALKLLPADFTRDRSRMRRFQQEARAASALNHPNILTIHDIGEFDGQSFIAAEFIDGETLRRRLSQQRMTIREVLDLTIQLASALGVAHEAGLVHRDLKPENLMLRRDGYVKVLDFGLVKLVGQEEPTTEASVAEKTDISSGLVMGTVKYMSPEQARGEQVDQRSDIFSFGVVLYEMLAGRTPFAGKTASELIAAIRKQEVPPLPDVPVALQRLVSKALHKKKEDRYQTIHDLLADLRGLKEDKALTSAGAQGAPELGDGSGLSTSGTAAISTASPIADIVGGMKRHKTAAVLIVASLAIATVGLIVGLSRLTSKPQTVRITLVPHTDRADHVAISPNGEYIAYAELADVGKPDAGHSLWVQEVATNKSVVIVPPANVDYRGLTYSPDGADLFYISKQVLYRIPANGGEITKVLAAVGNSISFAPDGTQFAFVRSSTQDQTVLMVANVDGSEERVVATRTRPDYLNWPAWSPDGRLIACVTGVQSKSRQLTVIGFAVPTGEEKRITEQKWDGSSGRMTWLPDGSSLLMVTAQENAGSDIWQIPYPSGEAHRITSDPDYTYYDLSLTRDGKKLVTIKYVLRSSLWVMPEGNHGEARPIASGELHRHVAWTPDGKILYTSNNASTIGDSRDIWIMNGDGTERKQLTAGAGDNRQPEPSADGRYIIFSSSRANQGAHNLWRMNMDGSNPLQLTHGRGEGQPAPSPDGRWLVYSEGGPYTTPEQKTIWKVSMDGGKPVQLCDRPSSGAAVSPDGTQIACWYQPDAASPMKIALIPFAGGPPTKIFDVFRTTIHPVRWSLDGQAIHYIDARPFVANIWSQPISGGPPKQLTQFTSERLEGFDWSRAGQLICSRSHSLQDVVMISNFK